MVLIQPQGTTIKRFRVGIVEFQTTLPGTLAIHAADNQFNANIPGLLFAVFAAAGKTGLQISPEQIGLGVGNGEQVLAVDGDPRPFAGLALALRPLLLPALQADGSQGQGLQDGGFAGVVGTNEHHGIPQGNLHILEALEIAGSQFGEHGGGA
ncbi:MAG: hypothetical protein OXH65_01275 [Paracoccaceae bacterium]|nr:hypothetical protein [Paracoccaceae bacterium]